MAAGNVLQFKQCTKCGGEKPLTGFHKTGKRAKNPSRGLGVQAVCKSCRSRAHNAEHWERSKRKEYLASQGLKECSICKVALPLARFNRSKCTADGLAFKCRDCSKRINADWRKKNPNGFKRWYEDNREARADYWQQWYEVNREHRSRTYSEWARANPHIVNSLIAKRNAAKMQATPVWADMDAIRAKYEEAARLTLETGIRHEVDHIYPLQGKNVCGLHVPNNLQILTRSQNAKKRNKMPEELGYV